jgi:hypothetical protein
MVEQQNRLHSKERSKKDIKQLLEEIINTEDISDKELMDKITKKIDSL